MIDPTILAGTAMSRRGFLALGACAAVTALFPGVATGARYSPTAPREISFHNLHTDESLTTVYWEQGEYRSSALTDIDTILRDHYSDEMHHISPRLIDLLFALRLRLGTKAPFGVISGYRSPETNARLRGRNPSGVAERSYHLTGEAIDIRFPDLPLSKVRDAALALNGGGVGYYPRSSFVHLDIGPVRRW